jgi:hypothetical protein
MKLFTSLKGFSVHEAIRSKKLERSLYLAITPLGVDS